MTSLIHYYISKQYFSILKNGNPSFNQIFQIILIDMLKYQNKNGQLFLEIKRKYINSCVRVRDTLKHVSNLFVEQKVWSKTDWHSSELILKQSWQLNPLSIQMIDVSVKSCYLFHLLWKVFFCPWLNSKLQFLNSYQISHFDM